MTTQPPQFTPRQVLLGLLDPWLFLYESLSHLPTTLFHSLFPSSTPLPTSPGRSLREAWFSSFWATVAPGVRSAAERRVVPLLRGRVRNAAVIPPGEGDAPWPPVGGTVIEIGPGSGMWVSLFSDRYLGGPGTDTDAGGGGGGGGGAEGHQGLRRRGAAGTGVVRVLGVEPNPDMHAPLRSRVREAGLEGVYELVPVGIEDLARSGVVRKGEVDCVVSILCLCGIPEPERNIRELYAYLRPGGRWYVYEHVRCRRAHAGWWMGWYQALVNIFWPPLIGGCQLRRDTEKSLREAGPWSSVDLDVPADEPWFSVTPHILGVLTK